jgi:hypothetical protein
MIPNGPCADVCGLIKVERFGVMPPLVSVLSQSGQETNTTVVPFSLYHKKSECGKNQCSRLPVFLQRRERMLAEWWYLHRLKHDRSIAYSTVELLHNGRVRYAQSPINTSSVICPMHE